MTKVFHIAIICAAFMVANATAARDNSTFSPKQRQADIGQLRDFLYPPGYSNEAIVDLENGRIPAAMTIAEYSRLHCGESARVVLNPCLVRSRDKAGVDYFVIAQGGNKHFRDLPAAAAYFRERVVETIGHYESETAILNAFIDDFCMRIATGEPAQEILRAKGQRPRLTHAIAPADPDAKYPFSNLFQWEKCLGCLGIVAINQPAEAPPASCGNVRKLRGPRISFFVVNRLTSRGHGDIDDGLATFARKAGE